MSAIKISNLQYLWPESDDLTIDIPTLQVDRKGSVFLQGASGSGKSTLLSLLAGTLKASGGTLQVLGTDLNSLSPRQRDRFRAEHIGIVFQQFNLIPFLTVLGNLKLASRFVNQSAEATDCTLIFASHDSSLARFFDSKLVLSEVNRSVKKETVSA